MYAVIGAGPMGLACARNLQLAGLDFTGFELHSGVGGLWDIDNPHSTMYDSAHLISSKRMTEFVEFPMRGSTAQYPRHDDVRAYMHRYAQRFGLDDHYQFATTVRQVSPHGGQWQVITETDGRQTTRLFDGVLVANGTLHTPKIPALAGSFAGDVLHSASYRSPDIFDGKRVLIIGCGNSGADIAVDAVHRATSVDISVRRGYHFVPKFIAGRPVDTIGGRLRLPRRVKQRIDAALVRTVVGRPSDFGLPNPDYQMYESHPVVNTHVLHHIGHGDISPHSDVADSHGSTVIFTDGTSGEYDMILLATGYHLDYPFVDRSLLNWPAGAMAPQLYLNVFPPHVDGLFIMGMIEAAGLGWEGRNQQARLVAGYLRHKRAGTPAAADFDRTRRKQAAERINGGYDYIDVERMAYYVNKEAYLDRIAGHLQDLAAERAPQEANRQAMRT